MFTVAAYTFSVNLRYWNNTNTIKIQEDIDLFCWQVRELKNTSNRKEEFSSTGMRGGGNICSRIYELAWNWTLGMYPNFLRFLLSDEHLVDAPKYQQVLGFGTVDIFSCLLVINRKLSWGTVWEYYVTGLNKCRIDTMFRTNWKRGYFYHKDVFY